MSKAIDLENGLPAIKTWVEGKFVEKEAGKGLSTNDYTTDEKTKLAGISAGAEVNVQSDWNQTTATADDYIKNKPSIPTATTTTPKMDGTAAVGSETKWARGDHVHPTDTSRAPITSPDFQGTPTAPTATAGTNTTQIATTAFVKNAVDNVHIDVDSALDDTSTNPVQNKVIAAALDDKVDASVTDDGATTTILNNGVLASATYSQGSGNSAIYNQVRVNGATAELYGSSGTTKSASVVANQNGSVSISAINGSNMNSITLSSTQTTIENVVAPTANGDAANKKYVDDALAAAKSYADGIGGDIPSAADAAPLMDGTAAVGTSTNYAREDHVHPTDTSRAANVDFTPATTSAAGAAGLVPAPAQNTTTRLLAASGWKDLGLVYNNSGNLQNLVQSKGINGDSLNFQVKRASTNAYGVTILTDSTSSTSSVEAASGKAVSDALAAAKSYADGKVTGLYSYKGSVASYADLPESPSTGDVYNVEAAYGDYPAGTNWAWTGTVWDALGGSFTIDFATAAEVTAVLNA